MQFYTSSLQLQDSVAQVMDVFGKIKVHRYKHTNEGPIKGKSIDVPCVYGTRSRIVKSIESKTGTHTVPFIAISTGSIAVDDARVHSNHEGLLHQFEGKDSVYDCNLNAPTPVTIEYNMTIVSKYHEDMDQICLNFLPHFKPDVSIVTRNPKIEDTFIKTSLLWDKSLSYEFPEEIAESDVARIVVTTSFTHRTWIWPGEDILHTNENGEEINIISGNTILNVNINNTILNDVYGTDYSAGTLEHFYDVPNSMEFDEFTDNIISGYIKKDRDRLNWDVGQSLSGDINGNIEVIQEEVPEHRQTKNWENTK